VGNLVKEYSRKMLPLQRAPGALRGGSRAGDRADQKQATWDRRMFGMAGNLGAGAVHRKRGMPALHRIGH
jgi:hypothetical protein